jgi:hypothetical protein
MPLKGEGGKTHVLLLFEISDRLMSMSALGAFMEVIGFYAPPIADYPHVPATGSRTVAHMVANHNRITPFLGSLNHF